MNWIYEKFLYYVGSILKMFLQNPNMERVKGHHVITYEYNQKTYKIIYKHKRVHKVVLKITTLCDLTTSPLDVSEKIRPYLGPFYDFHGMKITPKDLGYSMLQFDFLIGETKIFNENDVIEL